MAVDGIDLRDVTEVAVEWFDQFFSTFSAEVADREDFLVASRSWAPDQASARGPGGAGGKSGQVPSKAPTSADQIRVRALATGSSRGFRFEEPGGSHRYSQFSAGGDRPSAS